METSTTTRATQVEEWEATALLLGHHKGCQLTTTYSIIRHQLQ